MRKSESDALRKRVTELEKRLATAEARIAMLEARPPAILPPIFDPGPVYPAPVYQPITLPYTVSIGNGCWTPDTTSIRS